MSLGAQPPIDTTPLSGASNDDLFATQTGNEYSAALSNTIDSMSSNDVGKMLRLIEAVGSARDRTAAAESIVRQISVHFPGANVRCGSGTTKLSRLFDRKLGWVGPESTLFGESQRRWDYLQSKTKTIEADEATLVVTIPSLEGDGCCVVWIDGQDVVSASRHWLLQSLPTLRVVYWEKPIRWWLRTPERIGLGSSLWVAAAIILFTVIALWPIRYRIACTTVVQPVQQRLVAAPFEATLLESRVKPGDSVEVGDTLAVLDGRPLRLDVESVQAELQEIGKEQTMAMAAGRVAEAQRAALKKKQLQRKKDLLSDRLSRLNVVSPIAGVVVSGELERFIGSPLEMGQTIVEIAPLDRMEIEVEIPEHELVYVQPNADARIKISAIGGHSIRTKLQHIYPAAEIRGDRSVFVASVEVDNADGKLRPGMQGDATTYGPRRPAAWPWIRGCWEQVLWWIGY